MALVPFVLDFLHLDSTPSVRRLSAGLAVWLMAVIMETTET